MNRRFVLSALALPALALTACGATEFLSSRTPVEAGRNDYGYLYAIKGHTLPDDTDRTDARKLAQRYAEAMCPSGPRMEFIDIRKSPMVPSTSAPMMLWTATFSCRDKANSI